MTTFVAHDTTAVLRRIAALPPEEREAVVREGVIKPFRGMFAGMRRPDASDAEAADLQPLAVGRCFRRKTQERPTSRPSTGWTRPGRRSWRSRGSSARTTRSRRPVWIRGWSGCSSGSFRSRPSFRRQTSGRSVLHRFRGGGGLHRGDAPTDDFTLPRIPAAACTSSTTRCASAMRRCGLQMSRWENTSWWKDWRSPLWGRCTARICSALGRRAAAGRAGEGEGGNRAGSRRARVRQGSRLCLRRRGSGKHGPAHRGRAPVRGLRVGYHWSRRTCAGPGVQPQRRPSSRRQRSSRARSSSRARGPGRRLWSGQQGIESRPLRNGRGKAMQSPAWLRLSFQSQSRRTGAGKAATSATILLSAVPVPRRRCWS